MVPPQLESFVTCLGDNRLIRHPSHMYHRMTRWSTPTDSVPSLTPPNESVHPKSIQYRTAFSMHNDRLVRWPTEWVSGPLKRVFFPPSCTPSTFSVVLGAIWLSTSKWSYTFFYKLDGFYLDIDCHLNVDNYLDGFESILGPKISIRGHLNNHIVLMAMLSINHQITYNGHKVIFLTGFATWSELI